MRPGLALILLLAASAAHSSLHGIHVTVHEVRAGETAESLLKRYRTTRGTLESLNPGLDLDSLAAGVRIRILSRPGIFQKVQPGVTVSDLALAYQISNEDLLDINGIADPRKLQAGSEIFIPDRGPLSPAKRALLKRNLKRRAREAPKGMFGRPLGTERRLVISDGFGNRRNPISGKPQKHLGIDLVAPWGTPILAARDGSVTFVGRKGGYGKLVILKHANGYESYYAHATEITVRVGEKVSRGQAIGRVGATGDVTAPHLHFELRRWGVPWNPAPYLRRYL